MNNKLASVLKEHNIYLNERQIEKLVEFAALLKEWNKKINLTALDDDEQIIYKHFLDSLFCLNSEISWENKKVIDIGTGAGFPGVPLKIAIEDMNLCLFDSLLKRINYLKQVVEDLDLSDTTCIHGRAEDLAKNTNYREKFDIVTARAVARLPILLELCTPFIKKDGFFIALKGPEVISELEESKKALELLGAEVYKTYNYDLNLPDINHKRSIIVFKKNKDTPDNYPRKSGVPQKRPLI